jgi:hypothetical protein
MVVGLDGHSNGINDKSMADYNEPFGHHDQAFFLLEQDG